MPEYARSQLRQFFGSDDECVYVKAKFVTKGSVLPEDLIFETRESRLEIFFPSGFEPLTFDLTSQ